MENDFNLKNIIRNNKVIRDYIEYLKKSCYLDVSDFNENQTISDEFIYDKDPEHPK